MAEERPLAESAYSRLLGVTGWYWQQSSYSKNAKFNGACSSCRPGAAFPSKIMEAFGRLPEKPIL
jgi:hypothetical protein